MFPKIFREINQINQFEFYVLFFICEIQISFSPQQFFLAQDSLKDFGFTLKFIPVAYLY